jgi:branched-chain amino acid transport system permease protein
MELLLQQILNGLMQGSVYALVALGLTLIFGLLGVLNFAQGQFIALGAYVAFALLQIHVPLLVAFAIAVMLAFMLGSVLEWLLFRRVQDEPIKGLLISVGLIAIGEAIFLQIWGPDSRQLPTLFGGQVIRVAGLAVIPDRLVIFAMAVGVFLGLAVFLAYSRWGKAMRGTAQNRDAAYLMGIPVSRIVNASFGTGTALASMLGVVLGGIAYFDPFIGDAPLIKGFIALILGGPTSPLGALAGGILLGLIEALGGGYISSTFQDVIAFVTLILVMLVRPNGLFAGAFTGRP